MMKRLVGLVLIYSLLGVSGQATTAVSGTTQYFSSLATNINATTTDYIDLIPGFTPTPVTTAVNKGTPLVRQAIFSGLCVTTNTAQPGTGALVITLEDNGADTAITLTLAAGVGTGVTCDTAHTVIVSSGHHVEVKLANAASASSASITSYSWLANY